ncbi:MAG: TolC family protein [Spirochaetales bacterium]|nr:TolC family protein [Spirochaetales bacterium]
MKKILTILFLTLTVFITWADDSARNPELKAIDEIIEYAVENNPDLETAAWNLRVARENLTGLFTFEESSLTGESSWNSTSGTILDTLSGSLRLNVPVTDQISLSGSWDLQKTGSAGISVKPFNLTTKAESSRTTLLKAEVALEYLTDSLEYDTAIGVLNYLKADQGYNLQKEKALLAEKQYEAGYAQYLEGDITYQDLQDLNDDLTTAQSKEIEKQIALADSRSALILLLGPEAEFLPAPVTNIKLEELVEKQTEIIMLLGTRNGSSQTLENAAADYELSKSTLSKTLVFQPDLSISSTVGFNSTSNPTINASISLTISPETFDQEGREQLKEKVNLRLKEVQIEEFKLEIQIETAIDKISAARKNAAISRTDLERKEIIYNETILLEKYGERTSLEAEDARLAYSEGELNLTEALTSIFKAQADYIALFP